jgi:hypothetical protein
MLFLPIKKISLGSFFKTKNHWKGQFFLSISHQLKNQIIDLKAAGTLKTIGSFSAGNAHHRKSFYTSLYAWDDQFNMYQVVDLSNRKKYLFSMRAHHKSAATFSGLSF